MIREESIYAERPLYSDARDWLSLTYIPASRRKRMPSLPFRTLSIQAVRPFPRTLRCRAKGMPVNDQLCMTVSLFGRGGWVSVASDGSSPISWR